MPEWSVIDGPMSGAVFKNEDKLEISLFATDDLVTKVISIEDFSSKYFSKEYIYFRIRLVNGTKTKYYWKYRDERKF